MLKQIASIWKNNFGPQLTLIGATAGVIMSVLWYRDLLPEIRFAQPIQLPTRLYSAKATAYFVAKIECLGLDPADNNPPSKGGVVVFSHDQNRSDEERSPTLSKQFYLDVSNHAVVVVELPPGSYAAYAYLDTNGNDRLDFDADSGQAVEPVSTSGGITDIEPDDLAQSAFVVSADRPHFSLIQIDASWRRNDR